MHHQSFRVQSLQKEKSTHLYSKHSDFHAEFSQLQEAENKTDRERKSESMCCLNRTFSYSNEVAFKGILFCCRLRVSGHCDEDFLQFPNFPYIFHFWSIRTNFLLLMVSYLL